MPSVSEACPCWSVVQITTDFHGRASLTLAQIGNGASVSAARPCWSVVQNVVLARMNSGRLRWIMPLRCWMGSLRVRMYLG